MTVKDLKYLITDIPDDVQVYIDTYGESVEATGVEKGVNGFGNFIFITFNRSAT